MSEVSEWLTEVLAGHERDYAGDCSCSEYILEVPWEQHVADALAPIVEQMLAEARAEAWRDSRLDLAYELRESGAWSEVRMAEWVEMRAERPALDRADAAEREAR